MTRRHRPLTSSKRTTYLRIYLICLIKIFFLDVFVVYFVDRKLFPRPCRRVGWGDCSLVPSDPPILTLGPESGAWAGVAARSGGGAPVLRWEGREAKNDRIVALHLWIYVHMEGA